MKRRFAYCAILCMLAALLAHSTVAYYTAQTTVRNTVTSGGIDIQVVERQLDNGVLKPYPADPIEIMPGSEVSKVVSVQNLDEPAWVRMAYFVAVLDENEQERFVPAAEISRVMTLDTNTAKWTYKDGWWYYADALTTGAESTPLFTEVTFSAAEMGDDYQNGAIRIDVVAQAVQKVHNGDTVMDAAGWPVG